MVLPRASGHESHREARVVGGLTVNLAASAGVASIIMLATGFTTTGMSAVCVCFEEVVFFCLLMLLLQVIGIIAHMQLNQQCCSMHLTPAPITTYLGVHAQGSFHRNFRVEFLKHTHTMFSRVPQPKGHQCLLTARTFKGLHRHQHTIIGTCDWGEAQAGHALHAEGGMVTHCQCHPVGWGGGSMVVMLVFLM